MSGQRRMRTSYGLSSSFRPKPYGVEWRALDSALLGLPNTTMWVVDVAKRICENLAEGKRHYARLNIRSNKYKIQEYQRYCQTGDRKLPELNQDVLDEWEGVAHG